MSVVDEAVQDGIGVGGIGNEVMPAVHGKLAGDDGGAPAVAVVEDFEEIVTLGGVERFEAPVVKNEQLDAAEDAQQAGMATVAARQR